jgi:glycerol-3-phosphate O-acyltransferase
LKKEVKIYQRIIERIEEWPIYLLSKDRPEFVRQIDEHTFKRITSRHRKDLSDLLVKTIYQERIRIKESPWKVDPPNERSFWNRISKRLIKKSLDRNDPEAKAVSEEILQKSSTATPRRLSAPFKFQLFALPSAFSRLFSTGFLMRLLAKVCAPCSAAGAIFTSA